ncbi:MAG: glutamate synthase central domain-containing protein, partial [Phycisphaerales bacterium JB050]
VAKGRLQPGRMFLVNFEQGRIIADDELKSEIASRRPYGRWLGEQRIELSEVPVPPRAKRAVVDADQRLALLQAFGYTTEHLTMLMLPMVDKGQEAVGSMGNDAALAVLSDKPRLLYDYFKQLFAQVTNPPIDPIREEIIMSLQSSIGPEGNLLDSTPQQCHRLRLPQPILNDGQLAALRGITHRGWRAKTIDIYAEERVWEALHRVYKHVFDKGSNINDSFVADLIERRIDDPDGANTPDPRSGRLPASTGGAAKPIDLHDMRFTPVRLLHGHLPILGFRVEPVPGTDLARRVEASAHNPFPFAWCTDTSAIPPKSWEALGNLRALALDGLRHRTHSTHFNLDRAVSAAQQLGADQTWLIHIAHEILHERDEPDLPEGIRFGIDGLVLACDQPPRIEIGPNQSRSVPPVNRRNPDDPQPVRVEPEGEPS